MFVNAGTRFSREVSWEENLVVVVFCVFREELGGEDFNLYNYGCTFLQIIEINICF